MKGLALLLIGALAVAATGCGDNDSVRRERMEEAADTIVSQMMADPAFACPSGDDELWFGYAPETDLDPLEDVPEKDWDDVGRMVERLVTERCATDRGQ